MDSKVATRLRMLGPNLSLRGIIITLAVGVILPVLLSTTVGIVSLALGERSNDLVVGILVICFTAAAIGGAVTATVLVGRKARTARLQADFVANVSHELRTPLTAIRMYAQTLLLGNLKGDEARSDECLETIVRETMWLETIVDRVLTWRSSVKDQLVLERRRDSLEGAVQSALDRFGMLIAPGELNLTVEQGSRATVLHDPEGLSMVVLNLLINAYKYTGAEKWVQLTTYDARDRAVIEVEDNGIGVPLTERRRIFQPFYRIDKRLSGQASGAGLGLAIARALIVAHGGSIEVGSGRAGGARFGIRLPIHAEDDGP